VVPGLVDPHTHAVWAGDRLSDFEARTAGATYEEILAAGGGIRSTIRATAKASLEELVARAKPRLESLIVSGATTIEVKSGYGFTSAAELAMLEVIRALSSALPARILPTLLIHIPPANPAERASYLTQICEDLIPETAKRRLAIAVDVFVEKEAWTANEAEVILRAAKQHGLSTKLHSDQFHSVGGVELGIRMGALSIDHLEATGPEQIAHLAASTVIATILPGVSLHLGIPAAPGRALIDAGVAVAVGTDLNPGSSPVFSTSAAMALAIRLNGLTLHEALIAGTVNAACALGLVNSGRIEAGCPADFLVLHSGDWRDLAYTLGANAVREVWIGGQRVQG
jgi:imidazolonepropionase